MSTEASIYAQEFPRLYAEAEHRLASQSELIRENVIHLAQLGAVVITLRGEHKEDFWGYLRTLHPDVRENTIRIALKAYTYRERHPELEDTSQLTFALATGTDTHDQSDHREDNARPDNEIVAITKGFLRLTAQLNRLRRVPAPSWDPAVRRSIMEHLRPIVEFYNSIEQRGKF